MVATNIFDIRGKVALVTGGTSGIGTMIAEALVAHGAITYITGRDAAATTEVANRLSRDGQCHALPADLADANGPAALARQFAQGQQQLHVLVNNAGASERSAIDASSIEDWDRVMDVNLRAPYFLVQQLLPQLRAAARAEDPARIINIGSIGGAHVPNWEAFPYGASKAGVHHLTRALAKRLGREHIVVNAIAPGPFPSRMTDTASDAVKNSVATCVPLGRAGEARDLEGLVVFLASRASSYITGNTIPLDGGYLAAL
jgi:NAD(P)-dependent dehydrogenase (short-subunit alcohol dehydrogenase family)